MRLLLRLPLHHIQTLSLKLFCPHGLVEGSKSILKVLIMNRVACTRSTLPWVPKKKEKKERVLGLILSFNSHAPTHTPPGKCCVRAAPEDMTKGFFAACFVRKSTTITPPSSIQQTPAASTAITKLAAKRKALVAPTSTATAKKKKHRKKKKTKSSGVTLK